jgi:transposase
MAEIEIDVLERQCLTRCAAKQATVTTEAAARKWRRTTTRYGIEWIFTRRGADRKLRWHHVSHLLMRALNSAWYVMLSSMASKSDARKLDATALAHVRRSLVKAVRGGMSQTEAARVFGVSLRAANKWFALDKDGGLRALKLKRRGRRSGDGRLNPARAKRIRQMIIDGLPDQLKLPFYLWTRAAVMSLIEREYQIAVSLTTVGRYLNSWGMSTRKTARRAYERNDVAIERWLRQEYPAIARQAKHEKAVIHWGDETRLHSNHMTVTSYSLLGQIPLVRATGQRIGCNRISAITNRGNMAFMVFHDKFEGHLFVQFMQRLLNQTSGKLYLIVDDHPAHRSVIANQFVEENTARLHLIRMPGYCPELNPDELLNQDVKINALGKSRPSTRAEMMTGPRTAVSATRRSFVTSLKRSMAAMPPDCDLRTI